MEDLTIIYVTANETPKKWAEFHMKHLKKSIGSYPVIVVSRKFDPSLAELGHMLIDSEPKSYSNIYFQLLRASKHATTKYVAMAEDDTLYCPDHFNFFRPADDEVAYNMSKWSLFTWRPVFSLKRRKTNAALIAPREYLIDALEERFEKHPEGLPERAAGEVGRENVDRWLGVSPRKAVEVYSTTPIIQVSHPAGTEERQKMMRKNLGAIRAMEIPYWGRGENITQHYD